jgi:hypothetical protein
VQNTVQGVLCEIFAGNAISNIAARSAVGCMLLVVGFMHQRRLNPHNHCASVMAYSDHQRNFL